MIDSRRSDDTPIALMVFLVIALMLAAIVLSSCTSRALVKDCKAVGGEYLDCEVVTKI